MKISGKTVIVTGAGGIIGRAIACEFARQGGRVVCVSRTDEHLSETVRMIDDEGGTALPLRANVTNRVQVEAMVAQTITTFGRVDVLVNNAAVFQAIGGLWEVEPDTWWSDVTTNLLGPFLCCRSVLPHMMAQREGIVINMAGGGFDYPNIGGSGYGSSKAALMRLTDTLAFELSESYNIQVYGLNPGFVRSGMTEHLATSEQGLRWLPHVAKGLLTGTDNPPELAARAATKIVEISSPALSGRIFSITTKFEHVAQSADDIKKRDIYQLRMRY